MPGSVGPSPDDYEVVVTETLVRDSACGLNSHEIETLNALVADLERRNGDDWELISAHRSVLVPGDTQHDAQGTPVRGRIVRHELAFRRSGPRRRTCAQRPSTSRSPGSRAGSSAGSASKAQSERFHSGTGVRQSSCGTKRERRTSS